VIDAIQIHAYARTAAEVLDKIRDYREGTYEGGTRHMNFNFIFLVPRVSAAWTIIGTVEGGRMMRRELERESLKDAVPSLSWHNDCFYIFCFDKSVRCVFRFIVFAEDFEGRNGRSKKKLWLTEVAAASNNGTFVTNFVHDLLSEESGARKILFWAFVHENDRFTKTGSGQTQGWEQRAFFAGLMNRTLFPYVSHVSWFSEFSFGSFPTGNYTPTVRSSKLLYSASPLSWCCLV
jgi:hypothetical protein